MIDKLKNLIFYLFNRRWDEDLTDGEEEKLQNIYENTISDYGWKRVFKEIDNYMRSSCPDGESACNFAHLYWGYNCADFKDIDNPVRFLGFIYYRMELSPFKYDAIEVMDGLVHELLCTEGDKDRDPLWNAYYVPEEDPRIIEEAERLRKENV
ncbi:hypothetical protein IJT93_07560 [bacterium]|nr:hypothetical protein [bacterium]